MLRIKKDLFYWFDYYTKTLNWKIVPCKINTKIPLINEWNSNYNLEEAKEIIVREKGNCNLSLLLGNVIDVENDSESAKQKIDKLTKNFSHPCYRSSKSTHHLFYTKLKINRYFKNCIDIRGFGHLSLLPPSIAKDNSIYKWNNLPTKKNFVTLLPKSIVDLVLDANQRNLHLCKVCKKSFFVCEKKYQKELDVNKRLLHTFGWKCNKCKSELDRFVIKKAYRTIL